MDSAHFFISSIGRVMLREISKLRIAAIAAIISPPIKILFWMLLRVSSMALTGMEVRTTARIWLLFLMGTPTYIMVFSSVRLYLMDVPKRLDKAWMTSGRSMWVSMLAGSSSESPMTSPEERMIVIRVEARFPISLHKRSTLFASRGLRYSRICFSKS
ncbi:hypothetical protein ES703_105353 [subsurface metagenome]